MNVFDIGSSMMNAFIGRIYRATSDDLGSYKGYSVVAKMTDGDICIPSFMSDIVFSLPMTDLPESYDIVCRMQNFGTTKASTTSRIFNMFTSNTARNRFINLNTGKGYGYKGIKGMILDDDYKPLMICCNKYHISEETVTLTGHICMLSPEVFVRKDLISRFIVKNIVPVIPYIENTRSGLKYDIFISESINDFIHHVEVPEDRDFNDTIYKVLEANIEEIVNDA